MKIINQFFIMAAITCWSAAVDMQSENKKEEKVLHVKKIKDEKMKANIREFLKTFSGVYASNDTQQTPMNPSNEEEDDYTNDGEYYSNEQISDTEEEEDYDSEEENEGLDKSLNDVIIGGRLPMTYMA